MTTDRAQLIDEEQRAPLAFSSLPTFVSDYLALIIQRRMDDGSHLWCPSWWAHPEAIARLAAMWRAFEYLRSDPAIGLSNWWLHHADPHLAVLLSPTGPFHACAQGHRSDAERLPLDRMPAGLMDDPVFTVLVGDPFAM